MRRVIVSYGRTIQSAPFESIRLDVSVEKDVKEDDDLRHEIDKSVNGLRGYIKNKLIESLKYEKGTT